MAFASVILPSVIGTLGSEWAFHALHVDVGFWRLPMSSMPLVAVVVCIRFWLGLSTSATALATMRARYHWRPTVWVAPTVTFEAGLISLGLIVPVAACLLFLVVPGVLLALRWSQATMLILDRRASWFESARESEDLTAGRRLVVLWVWLIAGALLVVGGWLGHNFEGMARALDTSGLVSEGLRWLILVAADVFNLTVVAALYFHLMGAD